MNSEEQFNDELDEDYKSIPNRSSTIKTNKQSSNNYLSDFKQYDDYEMSFKKHNSDTDSNES